MKITHIRHSTLHETNPEKGNRGNICPPHAGLSLSVADSLGASEGKSKDLDALTQLCLCRLRLGTDVLLLSQGGWKSGFSVQVQLSREQLLPCALQRLTWLCPAGTLSLFPLPHAANEHSLAVRCLR